MSEPKWKHTPSLYDCERDESNRKKLKYGEYINEFLSCDPIRDWESIVGCINLWYFAMTKIKTDVKTVLDAGTKDGQFTEYLNGKGYNCTGIEIDDNYVKYAQSKKRKVVKNDICNMTFEDNTFDVVFSHHVLGLCPDYQKAYSEMIRVCKPEGHIITLNQIPGNKRKHYCLIESPYQVTVMIEACSPTKTIFFDYVNESKKEFVVMLKKC